MSLRTLEEARLVAIIRGIAADQLDKVFAALVEGGVRCIEVTMNTDGALAAVTRWVNDLPPDVTVGVGTVLDVDSANEALSAGAQFLVTPNLDEDVIRTAVNHGTPIIPGAMTPTEIVKAWRAGASAVKVFPMGSLGLNYFKEIRAPLDTVPMIPTGGIHEGNLRDFLRAGAIAVGVGGRLVDKDLVRSGDFAHLTERAKMYVRAVHEA